ncbi:MAG: DUF4838 domain-containing protein [Clostridia bacterium]|nr:DUF4838 domain-containing protein [Clostridia bacterium]
MKKLVKLIAIVLSMVCVLSATVGCNKESSLGNSKGKLTYTETPAYLGGTHTGYDSITPVSGEYVLKDGNVNYKVIVPEVGSMTQALAARVTLAKNDFKEIFMKATGKFINVETEAGISELTGEERYIIIGSEKLEQMAGLSIADKRAALNANGFTIKTVGKNIFITAEDSTGALFGAYELLTQMVGYERYTVEHYEVKNVTEIQLMNYDIVDNPDIERRIGPYGDVYTDSTNANRMRFLLNHRDIFARTGDIPNFHNTLEFLPPEKWMATHPEWYDQKLAPGITPVQLENVFQLCYTAGKFDPEANLAAVMNSKAALANDTGEFNFAVVNGEAYNESFEIYLEEMSNRVIACLEADRVNGIVTITAEDNKSYCKCSGCVAANDYYGAISGPMYNVLNEVCRRVQYKLKHHEDETMRDREALICMFAYHGYIAAPVITDAATGQPILDKNGNPQPVDASVVGESNTAIYMTSSGAVNSKSFNDVANKEIKQRLKNWEAICDHFGAWLYQTTYDDYFMPYDNFGSMQDNYKMLAELGVKWMFNQGQQGNENPTHFSRFKLYLNSKYEWNVNENFEEMYDNYFNYMYGPAAADMKAFFTDMRLHFNMIKDVDFEGSLVDEAFFPYAVVKRWSNYCDKAYEKIASLQSTNPELWEMYRDNIVTESLMPRYMIIKWHDASIGMGSDALAKYKREFKEDCRRVGITEWAQHDSIEDIIGTW